MSSVDLFELADYESDGEANTQNPPQIPTPAIPFNGFNLLTDIIPPPQEQQTRCPICWNEPNDSLTLSPCSRLICRGCFNTFVQGRSIIGMVLNNLWCPACGSHGIPLNLIFENCKPEIAERFQEILLLTALNQIRGFVYCPDPKCGFGFEFQRESSGCAATCPACSRAFCVDCKDIHDGITCQEFQLKILSTEEYKQFDSWKTENTAQTCQQCSSVVSKNGGCNHMTCLKCRYEWCWDCKLPFAGHVCPLLQPPQIIPVENQQQNQELARIRYRSRSRDRDRERRRRSRERSRERQPRARSPPRYRERSRSRDRDTRSREVDYDRRRENRDYRERPYRRSRSRSRSRDRYRSRDFRDRSPPRYIPSRYRDRSPARYQNPHRTVDPSLRVVVSYDRRVY